MSEPYEVIALSPTMGVEVKGLDLRQPLSPQVTESIKELFDEHLIVLFRGQELAPEDHVRVVESLFPIFDSLEDGSKYYSFDDSLRTDKVRHENIKPGHNSHADFMWTLYPIPLISLYGVEVTDQSSGTRFINATRAALDLTSDQKERLGALKIRHESSGLAASAIHPLITTHPRTGKPVLYMGEIFSNQIEGLTEAEAQSVLDEVVEQLYRPEYVWDHSWLPGDLLLWDNLALVHGRLPSGPSNAPRVLRRVCGSDKTFAEMIPDQGTRERYRERTVPDIRHRSGVRLSEVGKV